MKCRMTEISALGFGAIVFEQIAEAHACLNLDGILCHVRSPVVDHNISLRQPVAPSVSLG